MSHPPVDPYQSALDSLAPNASRLKRSTNTRLGRALLVAVNLHLLAVACYWMATYATAESAVPETKGTIYVEVPIFDTPPISEAPAPPSGTVAPVRPADLGTPTPVPDTEADPEATVATEQERLADPGIGPVGPVPQAGNGEGVGEGSVPATPVVPVVPKPGSPPSQPPIPQTPDPVEVPEEVLTFSEVMPELIGGIEALQAGIEYPTFDREAGLQGKVTVQFVVSETGVPSNIVVVRSVSAGLDRAAVEAIRRARFAPGRQNGRPVRVQYTLPVTFRLQ